jgi:hypothetical protein
MIFYWSTWNLAWFSASYLNYLPFNAPLKVSLLGTSLIGGFTVYVYPRKLKMRINKDKVIYIPFSLLVAGDILFHQFPFIYTLIYKQKNENNNCGFLVFLPITSWFGLNYLCNINMNKLYGISIKKLFLSSLVIFGGHSFCYHIIRKKLIQ